MESVTDPSIKGNNKGPPSTAEGGKTDRVRYVNDVVIAPNEAKDTDNVTKAVHEPHKKYLKEMSTATIVDYEIGGTASGMGKHVPNSKVP